jgi:hypothetical protein
VTAVQRVLRCQGVGYNQIKCALQTVLFKSGVALCIPNRASARPDPSL